MKKNQSGVWVGILCAVTAATLFGIGSTYLKVLYRSFEKSVSEGLSFEEASL